jgi:hypothetical protein
MLLRRVTAVLFVPALVRSQYVSLTQPACAPGGYHSSGVSCDFSAPTSTSLALSTTALMTTTATGKVSTGLCGPMKSYGGGTCNAELTTITSSSRPTTTTASTILPSGYSGGSATYSGVYSYNPAHSYGMGVSCGGTGSIPTLVTLSTLGPSSSSSAVTATRGSDSATATQVSISTSSSRNADTAVNPSRPNTLPPPSPTPSFTAAGCFNADITSAKVVLVAGLVLGIGGLRCLL